MVFRETPSNPALENHCWATLLAYDCVWERDRITAFDVGVLPKAIFELVLAPELSWKNGRAEHTKSKVQGYDTPFGFPESPNKANICDHLHQLGFKNNFPFVEFSLFFEIVIILDTAA